MLRSLILLTAFVASAVSSPIASPSRLHERRDALPRDILRTGRVAGDSILPIRIALTQGNLEHAYDHVEDVSHPSSAKYGQHWTAKQVDEMFAPARESVEAVSEWLASAGIVRHDIKVRKGWMAVDMPASDAERLFVTEYHEHEDPAGRVRVGCNSYHIPQHLADHIDYVRPGVVFSPPVKKRSIQKRGLAQETALLQVYASEIRNLTANYLDTIVNETSSDQSQQFGQAGALLNGTDTCGSFITPACIRALYDIPVSTLNDSVNALGIFESEGETWAQQDLNDFFATVLPNVPNGTHPEDIDINNSTATAAVQYAGGETTLDIDIAYSLIYPQTVHIYESVGSAAQNKTYYSDYAGYEAFFDAVDSSYCNDALSDAGADCGTVPLTRVTSFSYGIPEIYLPEKASKRMCHEFMKLTLQGHTFVGSSGDYGVASHPEKNTTGCISHEDPTAIVQNGTAFNPQFPDSCPFVLAVGATQVDANATVHDPESLAVFANEDNALHTGGTGGGFSNYNTAPAYQKRAVESYFANHNPGYPTYDYRGVDSIGANGGKYNRIGRGFPDVSANGNNLLIFVAGKVGFTGGTSMSTPLWASIITLINEERTAAGKGPVGFVQPVLYEHPEAFNDIFQGSNPGCGTNGFTAVPGWDPASGLGTPNYPKLLEVFMNLP